MFGVEQFVAVLNPPQVAILAVGAIKDRRSPSTASIDVAPLVQLTLTCDHRAIDGADGARVPADARRRAHRAAGARALT